MELTNGELHFAITFALAVGLVWAWSRYGVKVRKTFTRLVRKVAGLNQEELS